MQIVLGSAAFGVSVGIGVAFSLGSVLYAPGVGLLLMTVTFLTAFVPTAAIETVIRMRRLARRDNQPLQLTSDARGS